MHKLFSVVVFKDTLNLKTLIVLEFDKSAALFWLHLLWQNAAISPSPPHLSSSSARSQFPPGSEAENERH